MNQFLQNITGQRSQSTTSTMEAIKAWQLDEMITSVMKGSSDDRTAMLNTVQRIAEPPFAYKLLKSALLDMEWLRSITGEAFSHPNGFDKLTLLSSNEPEYCLRLHVWHRNPQQDLHEHIHDHSWNYSSAIVSGSFRMQTFTVDGRGSEMLRYECGFPDSGKGYQMRRIGTANVVCNFEAELTKGCHYSLDHGVLHRVHAVSSDTASLMLHGPFLRHTSNLLTAIPVAGCDSIIAKQLSSADVRTILIRILRSLP